MLRIAEQVYDRLRALGWHISFAESCTGGLVAAALVGISGASDVFDGSFITYANDAKVRLVGVKEESIQSDGVVSEEVATQMAEGCAKQFHAEVGVGISGIAGPTGGTVLKPVGTVCLGFYVNGETHSVTCHFPNRGRMAVRRSSVREVYMTLLRLLPPVEQVGKQEVGKQE
jgi:nicotinamide-nucleotide amidase